MLIIFADAVSEHEDGPAQGEIGNLECLLEGKSETERKLTTNLMYV
jgi:hypothetical protein